MGMSRVTATAFATVSATATSVTITSAGVHFGEIRVISEDVSAPVYFRADGVTAVARATGCSVVVGVGGETSVPITESKSVTVSLISTGTGNVTVVATERR